MNPRRPGPVNRVTLTAIGLICLAAGGLALARGLGAFGSTWASSPIIPDSALDRLQPLWWPRYAAAAAAAVIGVATLCWLVAQRPRRRSRSLLHLEDDPAVGTTSVHADTLADAVAADLAALEGVQSVRAGLSGRPPELRLAVSITPTIDSGPHDIREHLIRQTVPELASAIDLTESGETTPPKIQAVFHLPRKPQTKPKVH